MNTTLDQFFEAGEKEKDDDIDDIIREYHSILLKGLNEAYEIARRARKKGLDPEEDVEILFASDMAERVERLLGINGLAEKIKNFENEGLSREEITFKVADLIAEGKMGIVDKIEILDAAVRSSIAILTEGVVAAPIEGIARVDLGKNYDGTEYLKIFYAGPIRSAGGTAQVISILIGDYVRRKLGIGKYIPTESEVSRYVEEINLYKKVANLQYLPSESEIRLIVSNCPVCVDGEPTEEEEVSGYRDLDRIETNRVRGGMALVIAEGIALKAPKLKKFVEKLGIDGWDWLDGLIKKKNDDSENGGISPGEKFLTDLIAGRPVFSHPSARGGFRLRYGRARNSGLATVGLNPATMALLDGFIAIGTQLKIERPGKAGGVVPVSTIEGPTVRLMDGTVLRVDSIEEAEKISDRVEKIIDVGEILINAGDFMENNHPLMPASFVYEWWVQEVEKKGLKGDYRNITEEDALKMCSDYGVPLHPSYTYLWHDVEVEEIVTLRKAVSDARVRENYLVMNLDGKLKEILEKLLVPHRIEDGYIVLEKWKVLVRCLGYDEELNEIKPAEGEFHDPLEMIRYLSGLDVRAKAPTRIGARMGRPEKSRRREMRPPPHVLFPVGNAGGKTRSVVDAVSYTEGLNGKTGVIEVELPVRKCEKCGNRTFLPGCECGGRANLVFKCVRCGFAGKEERCPGCGSQAVAYEKSRFDLRSYYRNALERLGERETYQILKGVRGLTSKNKIPEPIEKGILRAKHGVYVFKDGTIRYDMTDLPLTHFRLGEIGLSVEKAKELGYIKDIDGNPLEKEDQIVELRPQDVVISREAAEYLLKVANFIDDLLEKFYGVERFYNAEKVDDLIGHLIIGLAPHTSAGVLGRIIGFGDVNASYAHPYFHAAKRRNCDGDEDCVMLLLDGLLNFSRSFLPEKRGGQMDAPLVLTTILDPREVDKEVHNMDIVSEYPLGFYRMSMKYESPRKIEGMIERVEDRLKSNSRYGGLRFTHDTEDICMGPRESRYKSLSAMIEKMKSQLKLASKIRAVDEKDVAERVLNTHFLPDLVGNLRAFSRQKFRCVKCNAKYRRMPLAGRCLRCGGNITLTVHMGTITKYLEISKELSEKYSLSEYTRQRISLIDLEIRSLFESDKSKQIKISDFI